MLQCISMNDFCYWTWVVSGRYTNWLILNLFECSYNRLKPAKLAYYIILYQPKKVCTETKIDNKHEQNMNTSSPSLSAEVPEFPRLHTNFHSHNINTAHVVRCRDDTWTQCIDTSWYTFGGGCRWKSWEFGDSKTTQNYCKIPSSILVYECQFTEYTCKIMQRLNTLTISNPRPNMATWPRAWGVGRCVALWVASAGVTLWFSLGDKSSKSSRGNLGFPGDFIVSPPTIGPNSSAILLIFLC